MGLNQPSQWVWLLLALPLLALYLFRPQHRPRRVAAAFLWRRVSEQQGGGSWWRRLQTRPELWLQLLVLLLTVAALLRPWLLRPGQLSARTLLLLDTSASMSASNRWHSACAEARRLVAQAPASTEFLVAGADSAVHLAQPWTSDRGLVVAALNELRPRAVAGDDAAAAAWALPLLQPAGRGGLHWFSDHALAGVPNAVHLFAEGKRNAGVTAFGVSSDGAFCALRNFSAEPVEVQLSLSTPENGHEERSAWLKGFGQLTLEWPMVRPRPGAYSLRLTPGDDLELDNQAWSVLAEGGGRLLQRGSVSSFLAAAAAAARGSEPVGDRSTAAAAGDLELWDRLPEGSSPADRLAAAPPASWCSGQRNDSGSVLATPAAHLPFSPRARRWGVRRVLRAEWKARLEPLLCTEQGEPLLVRRGRDLVWLFDVEQSELPLTPELPALLSALGSSGAAPAAWPCGSPVTLPPPGPLLGPRANHNTPEWPGLFEWNGRPVAASFSAPAEQTLASDPALAPPARAETWVAAETRPQAQELDRLLVLLALAVLLLEYRCWRGRGPA